MSARAIAVGVGLMAALGLGAGAGFWLAPGKLAPGERPGGGTTGAPAAAAERKVLYWHDPMVPGQRFDKPGKSPFMDMPLVPVYADGDDGESKVSISPALQQNLGIRTAEVTRGTMMLAVEAVGNVTYNERDVALVQARSAGFIEKLHVRATLDAVTKDAPLAELFVPEWVGAQEEFLYVRARADTGLGELLEGARQRMRLTGMPEDLIARVEALGQVQARVTLYAPITGVITELGAREGMSVMPGATLFRINGLDTVWVNAEIPESLAAGLQPGAAASARAAALPGAVFEGRINAMLPEVNAATRTIKARVELKNPGRRLMPGMFATIAFVPAPGEDLLRVPSEAVIRTGTRSVVIVAQGDGKFSPVNVQTGREAAGETEIPSGLEAGQRVVISGQFLIDSEASLKGVIARLGSEGSSAAVHLGEGKVEQLGHESITLSHGPIPSMQWGPMTMEFKLPPQAAHSHIGAGDAVTFEFRRNAQGDFEITHIVPADPAARTHSGAGKKP
jgi:membrane fusion protein, copper/silver efflux system